MIDLNDLETNNFKTYQEFDEFELKFNKFIYQKEILNLGSENYLNFDFYKYLNKKTDKIFCLSIPDNSWRGFFLEESKAKRYIKNLKKEDNRKGIGCGLFVAIAILIIILIIKN